MDEGRLELSGSDVVLFDMAAPGVARVRLNRPAARNAIDVELAAAIQAVVRRTEEDSSIRAVLLGSATPGMFCAGADLKVVAAGRAAELIRQGDGFAGFTDAPRVKPWIAAVDGAALGGGFELCLACDMIVASPRSRFGLPEVRVGLLAGAGGVRRIARVLPRNVALEVVATGVPIDAPRAAGLGLVNHLAPPEEVEARAVELAVLIAGNAPAAVAGSLAVTRAAGDLDDSDLRALSRKWLDRLMAGPDAKEGARAFVERRSPRWVGR